MSVPATRGRLNRMFKYGRNRSVFFRYEYNNSLGGHHVREASLVYDSFEIVGRYCYGDYYCNIVFRHRGETVWEQEFDVGWEFVGFGKLEMINSGPRCHFEARIL